MPRYILLFISCFFSFCLKAQQDLTVGGAILGGIPFNKYAEGRSVLTPRLSTLDFGLSLSARYRVFNRLALEGGLMQNGAFWNMKDKRFAKDNKGYIAKVNSTNYYLSCYGAVQYFQPIDKYTSLYGTLGYSMSAVKKTTKSVSQSFFLTEEQVTVKTDYPKNNKSWFVEGGMQTYFTDYSIFSFGLRFNKGLGTLAQGTYESIKGGKLLRSDAFTSTGTSLVFTIGYRYLLFHKDKKDRWLKPVEETPVIVDQPVHKINKKIDGRDLEVKNEIQVAAATIKISLWDDQKVDGDRVSLNLNDKWLIWDYTLAKEPKEITAEVHEGQNVLALHALNLGKISPNTAAISIDDGHKTQKILLSSDMKASGALIINYIRPQK